MNEFEPARELNTPAYGTRERSEPWQQLSR
jgi:hypothetical protein